MYVIENRTDLENELFIKLYDKWESLGGTVPRTYLLTEEFLEDMAGFSKIVVRNDEGRFLYVAAGAAFQELYQEIAGKYLDEVYSDWIRADVKKSYELCLDSSQPVYNRKTFATFMGKAGYEYILFPFLSKENEPPNCILSCVAPLNLDMKKYKNLNEIIKKTPWF